MKIDECPFCGEVNRIKLCMIKHDLGMNEPKAFVHCDKCEANGPLAKTDRDAVKKWNAAPRTQGKD